jgi:putative transposase
MKTDNIVGIDVGLKEFAVFSNNTIIPNPKHLYTYEKKLVKAQRELSRKQKGSNNRLKQRLRVRKIHAKIRDARQDFLHKTSNSITKNYDGVVLETLNIKGMMKNHKLARAIQDVSWGEIVRQLEYTAKWNDRQFVKIDRFFPSSKTCHVDGFILKALDLDQRTWQCPKCGTNHDRDINAAKNILMQGINILNNSGLGTKSEVRGNAKKQKLAEPSRRVCVKTQRDIEVMKPEASIACDEVVHIRIVTPVGFNGALPQENVNGKLYI